MKRRRARCSRWVCLHEYSNASLSSAQKVEEQDAHNGFVPIAGYQIDPHGAVSHVETLCWPLAPQQELHLHFTKNVVLGVYENFYFSVTGNAVSQWQCAASQKSSRYFRVWGSVACDRYTVHQRQCAVLGMYVGTCPCCV